MRIRIGGGREEGEGEGRRVDNVLRGRSMNVIYYIYILITRKVLFMIFYIFIYLCNYILKVATYHLAGEEHVSPKEMSDRSILIFNFTNFIISWKQE